MTATFSRKDFPICANYVTYMREIFGQDQITVIAVAEGEHEAGTFSGRTACPPVVDPHE